MGGLQQVRRRKGCVAKLLEDRQSGCVAKFSNAI